MTRRTAHFSAAMLLLVAASVHAEVRAPFSFAEEGILPSGRSYSLRIEEKPFVRRPDDAEDDGSRWGIDGGFPSFYCATFELNIDGVSVHLFRKLYEDLSHLLEVGVSEVDGNVQVAVRGGDAAGAFRAVFTVYPHEIVREVRHGEVPERIWERLVVHNEEAGSHYQDREGGTPPKQSLHRTRPVGPRR